MNFFFFIKYGTGGEAASPAAGEIFFQKSPPPEIHPGSALVVKRLFPHKKKLTKKKPTKEED